ncbi:MAG TPA: hypothetical protein PKW95_20425 [bacterium]|nr:hypothetical protein [bacterium]
MRRFSYYYILFTILLACFAVMSLGACGDDDDDNDDAVDDDDDDAVDDDDDDDVGDDDDDDVIDDDDDDDDDTGDDDDDDDTGDDDDDDDDDTTYEAQLIINGDFETGVYIPWEGDWGGDLIYSNETISVHGGTYAAWLGGRPNAVEWFGQTVVIPTGCADGTIHFWNKNYRWGAATGGLTVTIKDVTNTNVLVDILQVPDSAFTYSGEWIEVTYELTASDIEAIAMQNVILHFEIESTGGGLMANLNSIIDDVTFTVWY